MVSRLSHKEILVTGATGFIGANLLHRLVDIGCRPHITLRKDSNPWRISKIFKKIESHHVDLLEQNKLTRLISNVKPKIIYHCTTYGGYFFQRDFNLIINTNILGTLNLLNACMKSGFDCFVNSGTSSEYGIKGQPMEESDLLEPITDYGAAKASVTLLSQAVAKREKLPIITLRLFSPYGYYEEKTRLIPTVIISCLKEINPRLSSPNSVRDFIFIEDVIDAYIKVAQNSDKISGKILNIGFGKQYTVGKAVNKIISLTQSKVKPIWKRMPNPRIEPAKWVADIHKAEETLNWYPRHNLDTGLTKTISWFKKNLSLYKDSYL